MTTPAGPSPWGAGAGSGADPRAGPAPQPDVSEYREGGMAVGAALAAAAAAGRTGTAWLMGGNIGALYFRNGRVVGAELEGSAWPGALLVASGRLSSQEWRDFTESWGRNAPGPGPAIPPAAGLTVLEWAAISLSATVEAAFELLPPGFDEDTADMVFQPDSIPAWTGSTRPVEFDWLRAEMDRRQSVLERLRPVLTADTTILRSAPELPAPVQVSAQQWRALAAVGEGTTARALARRIGIGTFSATVLAATLIRLGMVTTRHPETHLQRRPEVLAPTLFSDAAVPVSAWGEPVDAGPR